MSRSPRSTAQDDEQLLARRLDEDAMKWGIILSVQQTKYGTNMLDSLTLADEPEIVQLVARGKSRNEVALAIFERRFGKVALAIDRADEDATVSAMHTGNNNLRADDNYRRLDSADAQIGGRRDGASLIRQVSNRTPFVLHRPNTSNSSAAGGVGRSCDSDAGEGVGAFVIREPASQNPRQTSASLNDGNNRRQFAGAENPQSFSTSITQRDRDAMDQTSYLVTSIPESTRRTAVQLQEAARQQQQQQHYHHLRDNGERQVDRTTRRQVAIQPTSPYFAPFDSRDISSRNVVSPAHQRYPIGGSSQPSHHATFAGVPQNGLMDVDPRSVAIPSLQHDGRHFFGSDQADYRHRQYAPVYPHNQPANYNIPQPSPSLGYPYASLQPPAPSAQEYLYHAVAASNGRNLQSPRAPGIGSQPFVSTAPTQRPVSGLHRQISLQQQHFEQANQSSDVRGPLSRSNSQRSLHLSPNSSHYFQEQRGFNDSFSNLPPVDSGSMSMSGSSSGRHEYRRGLPLSPLNATSGSDYQLPLRSPHMSQGNVTERSFRGGGHRRVSSSASVASGASAATTGMGRHRRNRHAEASAIMSSRSVDADRAAAIPSTRAVAVPVEEGEANAHPQAEAIYAGDIRNEDVQLLESMGFPISRILPALRMFPGNVSAAANYLAEHQTQ